MDSENASVQQARDFVLELLYDGECPLCASEVAMLRRLDRKNRIHFVDLVAPDFDPGPYGKSLDELMREIHARIPSGELVIGVEVFRRAYAAVGLGWLVAPTRWPLVEPLSDAVYKFFARWRYKRRFPHGDCARCAALPRAGERS